ncbi:MAG: hypothetical protein KBT35_03375 [Firmicutes bacterium]|nr:hypothetical protein [Candidatus Colivicinus equi]
MYNCFEHKILRKNSNEFPAKWKNEKTLKNLELFLQSCWNQRSAFYDDGSYKGVQQFIDFDYRDGIKTQNYIGTITFEGEQLNIFPKVFKLDESDYDASGLETKDMMKSLLIWIEYCEKSMFPFISNKSNLVESNSLKELLITLYIKYVKETIERQLYFQYEDITEVGTSIKGKINFNDYIINKFPLGDKHKFEYTYSSFEFDNKLNRIIKCVCNGLKKETDSVLNKKALRDILTRFNEVTNENCTPYDCDQVHLDSLHQNYSTILSMSKMFLLNKSSNDEFGLSNSFCFLFPAEMLFEGFVAGFMKKEFTGYANIRTQANDTHLAELVYNDENVGSISNLREDILIEKNGDIFIFDTKYKELDRFEKVKQDKNKLDVSDADLKQMAVYAAKRNAKRLCLIYPLHREEELEIDKVHLDIDISDDGSRIFPCDIKKIPFIYEEDTAKTEATIKQLLLDSIC